MRCSNILKFNRIGRMPKLVLALGVLALAVAVSGAAAATKAEAASGTYTLEISYESVRFADIDDGLANNTAELYGSIGAYKNGGVHEQRMLGSWANPGVCSASWTGSGQCNKKVSEGITNFFAQTPLCAQSFNFCTAPYATGNNKFRTTMTVDPSSSADVFVAIQFTLMDYDSGADDILCTNHPNVNPVAPWTGLYFQSSQVATLDKTYTLHDNAYDGDCFVTIRVRRV
jgi:hypothetical protein